MYDKFNSLKQLLIKGIISINQINGVIINRKAKQIFKIQTMSTTEYYRLALLQYIKMQHHMEDIQNSVTEIDQLKEKIACRHKKHRRSDKEIEKNYNCGHCQRIYATQVALRLHLKLKHRETILDKNSDSHTVVISESEKENIDGNIEVM